MLKSKKSALLILNVKEQNAKFGYSNGYACQEDEYILTIINSLRDKRINEVFGTFHHKIMAQDWQCFDDSIESNSTNIEASSDLVTWEFIDNGKMCKGPDTVHQITKDTYGNCEQASSIDYS